MEIKKSTQEQWKTLGMTKVNAMGGNLNCESYYDLLDTMLQNDAQYI